MKLVFYLYVALWAVSGLFGLFFYFITLFKVPELKLTWDVIVVAIVGLIELAFMLYAVMAFLKPLPGGAFVTRVLVGSTLLINLILFVGLLIKGNYITAILVSIALVLSILLFYFTMKNDEMDYLFPKEKRKLAFYDYLFAINQFVMIVGTVILVIFL